MCSESVCLDRFLAGLIPWALQMSDRVETSHPPNILLTNCKGSIDESNSHKSRVSELVLGTLGGNTFHALVPGTFDGDCLYTLDSKCRWVLLFV